MRMRMKGNIKELIRRNKIEEIGTSKARIIIKNSRGNIIMINIKDKTSMINLILNSNNSHIGIYHNITDTHHYQHHHYHKIITSNQTLSSHH